MAQSGTSDDVIMYLSEAVSVNHGMLGSKPPKRVRIGVNLDYVTRKKDLAPLLFFPLDTYALYRSKLKLHIRHDWLHLIDKRRSLVPQQVPQP